MIRHHPSEPTLIAQAAGHLPLLHARVLAVHLSACPHCRCELQRLEEVGGALIATLPPVALADDALSRVLARLDEPAPAETAPVAPEVPVTLRDLARGRWWWLGPGIRLMPLSPRDASGTRLDLIRVAPGVAMPGHGHTGAEIACILQGAYADETGEYAAYDIAEGDAALDHTPVASAGQECICLIATTGRLRGHTWLARLVQPLIDV
jgi:putative transcriptional regulator